METNEPTKIELSPEFVLQLTEAQPRLFGFLLKRLANSDQAHEVLEEVNVVICRKAGEFEFGSDFMAWSYAVCRFRILAFRKRNTRDRLVFQDDLAVSLETIDSKLHVPEIQRRRRVALMDYLERQLPDQRELVRRRYAESASVKAIAADLGKSDNAVSLSLHRIRSTLLQCVDYKLAQSNES